MKELITAIELDSALFSVHGQLDTVIARDVSKSIYAGACDQPMFT